MGTIAPMARARVHYNNWMNNKTINSAVGMASIQNKTPSATGVSSNPSYKTYVSPVLAASKRKMLAPRTSMGIHSSNNGSLNMSPMINKPRKVMNPKTDRSNEANGNFGKFRSSNQIIRDSTGVAMGPPSCSGGMMKVHPVNAQTFRQTPLGNYPVRQS